jgi:hypothetical protein
MVGCKKIEKPKPRRAATKADAKSAIGKVAMLNAFMSSSGAASSAASVQPPTEASHGASDKLHVHVHDVLMNPETGAALRDIRGSPAPVSPPAEPTVGAPGELENMELMEVRSEEVAPIAATVFEPDSLRSSQAETLGASSPAHAASGGQGNSEMEIDGGTLAVDLNATPVAGSDSDADAALRVSTVGPSEREVCVDQPAGDTVVDESDSRLGDDNDVAATHVGDADANEVAAANVYGDVAPIAGLATDDAFVVVSVTTVDGAPSSTRMAGIAGSSVDLGSYSLASVDDDDELREFEVGVEDAQMDGVPTSCTTPPGHRFPAESPGVPFSQPRGGTPAQGEQHGVVLGLRCVCCF